jgi:hypothetical protein
MVSKDQSIGGLILFVCLALGILYFVTLFFPSWLGVFGVDTAASATLDSIRFWVIAFPVFIAFIAIMAIGAWIGWTMATTPPPKPIEELTMEKEEVKEKEPAAIEEKPPEEKKPEKKKKSSQET